MNNQLLIFLYNSICVITIPMALNLISGMCIIILEIKKMGGFVKWAKENSFITTLFTIFASMDVGVLEILSSNFAEMKMLNSLFDKKSYKYVAIKCYFHDLFIFIYMKQVKYCKAEQQLYYYFAIILIYCQPVAPEKL